VPRSTLIRTATSKDEPDIRHVLERTYPLIADRYDPELFSEALPHLVRPDKKLLTSGRYYIAEIEGAPVACGGWSLDLPPGAEAIDNAAVIRRFAVVPELAGRGIGRRLFEQCAMAVRARQVRRMLVRSSLNAEPFYAALGFRTLRPIHMPLPGGRGLPCVLMERPL